MTEPVECRLDTGGLRRQRDRYRALGGHATAVERWPRRLAVRFGAGVDGELLRETVAIERECCPFFAIDADARTLVFEVSEPEHDPALDAIAHALGVGGG